MNTALAVCGLSLWLAGACAAECPANAARANATQLCTCNAGATGPDNAPCALCAPGTHKAQPGAAACAPCAAGTYTGVLLDMIGDARVAAWNAAGVTGWFRGGSGQSCDATCAAREGACDDRDFPQRLPATVAAALFAQARAVCGRYHDSRDASAPYVRSAAGVRHCYRGTAAAYCNASQPAVERLCPCKTRTPLAALVGRVDVAVLDA